MVGLFIPATHVIGIYNKATVFNMKLVISEQFCIVVEIVLTKRLGSFATVIDSTGMTVFGSCRDQWTGPERQKARMRLISLDNNFFFSTFYFVYKT